VAGRLKLSVVDPYAFRLESPEGKRKRDDAKYLQGSQSSLKEVRDHAWNMLSNSKTMEKVQDLGMSTPGLFAGVKSKTANAKSLMTADRSLKQGAPREAVRKQHGWFTGMDDKYRYEISDHKAKLLPTDKKTIRLDKALQHDELFAAYPHLRKLPVTRKMSFTSGGSYNPKTGEIEINPLGSKKGILSNLLHEVQHAVQEVEGFATGSSLSMARRHMGKNYWDKVQEKLDLMDFKSHPSQKAPSISKYVKQHKGSGLSDQALRKQYYDEFKIHEAQLMQQQADMEVVYPYYKKYAGEIESRDVSRRMGYDPAKRAKHPPVLRKDAVVEMPDTDISIPEPIKVGFAHLKKQIAGLLGRFRKG
jgi:hypothetical protein